MKVKTICAATLSVWTTGSAFPALAEGYLWANKDHACIVESAKYTSADGTAHGNWSNAPKTFFVKFSSCADFAQSKGLEPQLDAGISLEPVNGQWEVNRCAEKASVNSQRYQVIEVENNVLLGRLDPQDASWLSIRPLATGAGDAISFSENGLVDVSKYARTGVSSDANWFTLRARCTVLER
ncbi:MAG: hypothetical protein NXH72_08935 [Hyphomonadaceae bacterium]|nr:hypothetical protein [Hyphomonadaceae bacterium]